MRGNRYKEKEAGARWRNIVCRGQSHRILLHENGKLAFPDHNRHFAGDEAFELLGGGKSACLGFLNAWKQNPERTQLFVDAVKAIKDKRLIRKEAEKCYADPFQLAEPLLLRPCIIIGLVERYFAKSKLWRAFKSLRPQAQFCVEVGGREGVFHTNPSFEIMVGVANNWAERVYANGLGLLDGNFVVNIGSAKHCDTGQVYATTTIPVTPLRLKKLLQTKAKKDKIVVPVVKLVCSLTHVIPRCDLATPAE